MSTHVVSAPTLSRPWYRTAAAQPARGTVPLWSLAVFVPLQGPITDRGLGLGETKGSAPGPTGSSCQLFWPRVSPGPCGISHWLDPRLGKRRQSQCPGA